DISVPRGKADPDGALQGSGPLAGEGGLAVAGRGEEEDRPGVCLVQQLDQPRALDDPSISGYCRRLLCACPQCLPRIGESPEVQTLRLANGSAPVSSRNATGICRRLVTPSFCRNTSQWAFAVRGEIPSATPTSSFDS